jgi:hypothetical protein
METAKSIARGITEATIRPALIFPSNKTRMKITIKAPSIRFLETVPIARPTRSDRLRKGSSLTSFGSDF